MEEEELDIDKILEEVEDILPSKDTDDISEVDTSFDEQVAASSNSGTRKPSSIHDVDLTRGGFHVIKDTLSATPRDVFDGTTYYKTAMSGEQQIASRLHMLLSKYLPCTDPKDKTVYRQQITTAYWEFLSTLVSKVTQEDLAQPKLALIRFAVVLPSLFTAEQKDFFSRIKTDNDTGEPVLYLDEWFKEIAAGRMSLSVRDEGGAPSKGGSALNQQKLNALKTKAEGKLQSTENLLSAKENERRMIETELKNKVEALCEHGPCPYFSQHLLPYTEAQSLLFAAIQERLRALQRNNREIASYLNEMREAKETSASLDDKLSMQKLMPNINSDDINKEFQTVRQMAKMSVGRNGNHFPIFTREFYHCLPRGTGTRENVINIMAWIESIDPGCFCRIHKNVPNRIVPYTLLIPTYGDMGFCWEPFNRFNRVTSRGRIVIPMYPRDLRIAVITAVADLRWQVAKEKASYYWMEEGITGRYYQWIDSQKLKGDLKNYFIQDYILWITKESDGVQKLDKEVRAIFWRHIPFSQDIKDKLKTRSVTYQELYQRDLNRAMSDGY